MTLWNAYVPRQNVHKHNQLRLQSDTRKVCQKVCKAPLLQLEWKLWIQFSLFTNTPVMLLVLDMHATKETYSRSGKPVVMTTMPKDCHVKGFLRVPHIHTSHLRTIIVLWLCNHTIPNCPTWAQRNWKSAETHSRDGVNHAVCDLVLPHVFHHVKLGRSLLGYDLVSDLLQLGVELLKEILKQQGQKLERRTNQHIHDFSKSRSSKPCSKAQQCRAKLQSVD